MYTIYTDTQNAIFNRPLSFRNCTTKSSAIYQQIYEQDIIIVFESVHAVVTAYLGTSINITFRLNMLNHNNVLTIEQVLVDEYHYQYPGQSM